jgi:hypothetical protein
VALLGVKGPEGAECTSRLGNNRPGGRWCYGLPPIEEVTLRLDTLVSAPDSWRLYLRAAPDWYKHGEPDEDGGQSVREIVSVSAEDDRGAAYISRLGGNRHIRRRGRVRRDHEEHCLCFQPRLDPLAGALHLTVRGAAEEVLVTLDLG